LAAIATVTVASPWPAFGDACTHETWLRADQSHSRPAVTARLTWFAANPTLAVGGDRAIAHLTGSGPVS
jgi:hypothetical protein